MTTTTFARPVLSSLAMAHRVASPRREPAGPLITVPSPLVLPFLFGIYFPYIQVLPTGTDVQPTSLLLALLIVPFYLAKANLPRPVWWLGVTFLVSIGALAVSDLNYNAARSVSTYASLFFVAAAAFTCARNRWISDHRLLDACNYIWLAVGLTQAFFDPQFLYPLLSNSRTTIERGVISLAAEPSFYGIICDVMLLLYYLQRRERTLPALLCILQIFLVAQSATAGAVFGLMLGFYVLSHMTLRTLIASLFAVALASYIAMSIPGFTEMRLFRLAEIALETPEQILVRDHSASARFYHIAYSLKGVFDNWFVPAGYSAWREYYESQMGTTLNRYQGFMGFYYETPERIMSALGTAAFELGLAGFVIPVVVVLAVRRYYGTLNGRRAVAFLASFMVILLNSVPLSFPLYGFLIGYLFAFRDPAGASENPRAVPARRAPANA